MTTGPLPPSTPGRKPENPGEGSAMPQIRRARRQDAAALTRISFDSKRYWGYPEAYCEHWAAVLTIDAEETP
jgi:hypothetical protein